VKIGGDTEIKGMMINKNR